MNGRVRAFAGTIAALALAVALVTGQGQASPSGYRVPRTPWGEPDLQGTYNANDLQGIPFQRATSVGLRQTLNDDEYRQRVAARDSLLQSDNDDFSIETAEKFESFGAVGGPVSPPPHWLERARKISRQASFVIDPPDGRLPELTVEGRKLQQIAAAERKARQERLRGREADTYTDRSLYDRCITLGLLGSMTPKIYNSGSRIVQGPGWVAIQNEMIHETRVVPTDGRANAGPNVIGWMGNSVGRWDGDTLVIETHNVRREVSFQGAPLSSHGRVIERITMADASTLDYRLTVDDPKMWTRPWTMLMQIPKQDDYGFFEYACHEGNYTMFNILSGARAQERAGR